MQTTMKRYIQLFWAAALIALLPGCCEKINGGEEGGDVTPSEYHWHFKVDNADPAQSLGIFLKEYEGALTNTEIHPDGDATFDITTDYALSTGGKFYAYSPYNAVNKDHKALTLTIAEEQTAGAPVMPKVAVPLKFKDPSPDSTMTLRMLDLAGTLAVKVYSTQDAGEQLRSISFTSPDPLAGTFTFNAKDADPNQPSTLALSGYEARTVTLGCSGKIGTDADAAAAQEMLLAPGSYTGTLTVTTDKDTYGIVVEEPVTLTRGNVTVLPVRIAPKVAQDDNGNTEGFEGGELETGGGEAKPEGSISILAIGNSFSIDGMQYLWNILSRLGYTDIYLGNLYIAGCTLETHAANVTGNLKAYRYYTNGTGDWTSVYDHSSITALKERDWDFVTVQQASKFSGMADTYEPYLSTVLAEVATDCPKARRGWHMTWAYAGDYSSANFGNYGNNQATMYNAIVSTVQSKIVPRSDIDFVIPVGTAIQNLRTSFIGDHLNRDGTHLSYDLGRVTAAMMWARQITGKSVSGIKFTPPGYTISDEQFAAIWDAVDNAYNKPFQVTKSAYPGTEPEPPVEGTLPTDELKAIFTGAGYSLDSYEPVAIQFSHFAYWNTVNNGSTLQTTSNQTSANLKKFSATQLFDKTTLPVGSVIVLKDGYQYRPDSLTSLSEKTASSSRRGNVTASGANSVVVVDEAWWNDKGVAWNFCGFNLAKNGVSDLDEAGHTELEGVFAIFKPKN